MLKMRFLRTSYLIFVLNFQLMNKRLIWTIISVMSVALVGLLAFQAYWIMDAVKVKEQQFDQFVNRLLHQVVKELEVQEAASAISKEFIRIDELRLDETYTKVFIDRNYGEDNINITSKYIIRNGTEPGKNIMILNGDTILISSEKNPAENRPDTFMYNELRSKLKANITSKTDLVESVVNKMMASDGNISGRLDIDLLDRVISTVLLNKGIDLDYEFAVRTDRSGIGISSDKFDSGTKSDIYRTSLFPNDIFSTANDLLLYFPDKRNYIIKSIGIVGFSSLILTLIIIFGFSFAVYIILKQKKLSEMKTDLVNNMTHELKTPISTISLASQMLKDNSIPSEAKNLDRISGIIDDESKRLGFQVEKVLQMAVFDKGEIKLKIKKVNINHLISSVIENFRINVENRNGKITVSLNADPAEIYIDEVHMTNVILNLLDNSVKYSKDEPEITISSGNEKQGIILTVEDTGIGISKQEQKRIFDKFYRVSTGNVHNVKGSGLGLSYVKKIVEEHKGTIKIDSEPGRGTKFDIFLPLNQDK